MIAPGWGLHRRAARSARGGPGRRRGARASPGCATCVVEGSAPAIYRRARTGRLESARRCQGEPYPIRRKWGDRAPVPAAKMMAALLAFLGVWCPNSVPISGQTRRTLIVSI